jgi:hypothetical protein
MRLAIGAVILASMTSVASAGTYLGLGIGSESNGHATRSDGVDSGELAGYGRSGRLIVGFGLFSKLALEAQGSRFDVMFGGSPYQATQAALALKLGLPLGSNFHFVAKGGVERTWLTDGAQMDFAGNGLLLGGGFEYHLNLGLTAAAIFVDYQRASSGFSNPTVAFDGVTSMWTLGATVSL